MVTKLFHQLAFTIACTLSFVFSVYANSAGVSPTPEQLEQFKRLPISQQRQLAQQYGIDLSRLSAQKTNNQGQQIEPALFPRELQLLTSPELQQLNDNVWPDQDKTLKRFGYDLFAAAPSTFAQVSNVPVPASYVLGPGDSLSVQLFGKFNEQVELSVDRDGNVNFPELGPISIAGLSFAEAKALLHDKVKQQMIGVRSSITMGQLRTIQVFVLGDAFRPGLYTVSALSNISHALYLSGGISDTGSLRKIQLKRKGNVVSQFDLYDLLLHGDTSADVRLMSGDVVFIPPAQGSITVEGEIRRPAIYELLGGETVEQVVGMAGGLLPKAYPKNSVLIGYDSKYLKEVASLDLTSTEGLARKVRSGDYLQVRSTKVEVENGVLLIGATAHPGFYAWQQGMRISQLLPSIASNALATTDLEYGLVISEDRVLGSIKVRHFSLAKALAEPGSQNDLQLANKDRVLLFNRHDPARSYVDVNLKLDEKGEGITGVILADDPRFQQAIAAEKQTKRESEKEVNWQLQQGQVSGVQNAQELARNQAQQLLEEQRFSQVSDEEKKRQGYYIASGVVVSAKAYQLTTLSQMTPTEQQELLNESKSFTREELLSLVILRLKQQSNPNEFTALARVGGAVKVPGVYPVTTGARLTDLIAAAGGLLESADVGKAEISRVSLSNTSDVETSHFVVGLEGAYLESADSNPLIHPKDVVNIMRLPGWQDARVVTVKGEVRYPGTYSLKAGETLKDLIDRVGGFTDFAFVEGSVFTRNSIKDREKKQLERLGDQLRKQLAAISLRTHRGTNASPLSDYGTMQQLIEDIGAIEPIGRMVLDMPSLVGGDLSFDMNLENGDVLYVPSLSKSVSVIGEVQLESTHFFRPGLTMDDYISRSGGTREQADLDRIYVIKASGEVIIPEQSHWLATTEDNISPGDTVVVPLDIEYMDGLTLWSTATSILYNTAVAVAAVASL